ncbi:MAG: hypothetical protein AAF004_01750 [Pseudomonadota bacterium]
MRTLFTLIAIAATTLAATHPLAAQSQSQVSAPAISVNAEKLSADDIQALKARYGAVYAGDYWYDPISGLYGHINGAPMGQLHPGLRIGGPLAASASGGGTGAVTGVFINGREAHPDELRFYQRLFGRVLPGRYWMNALGIGGFEYMPASFNVRQAMAQSRSRARSGGRGSVYMDWIGSKPGTHVGRASDGCVYISQGDYSAESC